MSTGTQVTINVELSGGLELIFGNKKSHQVTLSASAVDAAAPAQIPIVDLLNYMKDNLLTERPELFLQNNTVRPGIIVMINDTDWELEGGDEAMLSNGDTISFISTLHGG